MINTKQAQGRRPKAVMSFGKRFFGVGALAAMTSLAAVPAAHATTSNLVLNGTFAVTGTSSSFQFGTFDQAFLSSNGAQTNYVPAGTVSNWSSTDGFNFVFQPGSAAAGATSMYTGQSGNLPFQIWNSSSTGNPNTTNPSTFNLTAPGGGNYIAADGAFDVAAISQTITGLTIGDMYSLTFSWAAAQENNKYTCNSSTPSVCTGQWIVSLAPNGSTNNQSTSVVSISPGGFSGWMTQTFNYVATATTETLSFLASGTPSGQPPVELLANVSLTKVPEPGTTALLVTGFVGLIGLRRFGRR